MKEEMKKALSLHVNLNNRRVSIVLLIEPCVCSRKKSSDRLRHLVLGRKSD